jgi:type IV pilus assembly protein PilN
MKIPINLSSQPFRRDRAMIVASLAVCAMLVMTLAGLVYMARVDRSQLLDLRRNIGRLQVRVSAEEREQQKLAAVLAKPENAVVLGRSVFINELLYHKGVSWSQIFEDLETIMPFNVKVLMLHPAVDSANKVTLDMMVGSESQEGLVKLLRALEQSDKFGEVYEHSQAQPTQSEPLNRMRVTVNYAH